MAFIFQFDETSPGGFSTKEPYLTEQLITYIGNKRSLLPFLRQGFDKVKKQLGKKDLICLDGFSGSGSVSRLLTRYASKLITNDLEPYCKTINQCFLSHYLHPAPKVEQRDIIEAIKYLNSLELSHKVGIIESLYAPEDDKNIKKGERVFYTNENAKIIDRVRTEIDKLPKNIRIFCLAPLLIKSSIHVNTSGVFKGFHKNGRGIGQFGGRGRNALKRICQKIRLDVPLLCDRECEIHVTNEDINKLIDNLSDLDLTYYDPPYNQHPYGSNYFMLNVINDYKQPDKISGVSGIPVEWNRSAYNKQQEAEIAMDDLIKNTNSKYILVSYNDEGIIPIKKFREILERYGKVELMKQEYNAYRGSRNLKDRPIKVTELLWILEKR